jgi:hypothetical protein
MSMQAIQLRKLLRIIYAPDRLRRKLLLDDIRTDARKDAGGNAGGNDFHKSFWASAKDHAAGRADIHDSIKGCIERSEQRKRLYPLLEDGFLRWWNETRRWRNEPFEFLPEAPSGRFHIPELESVVKVENTMAFRVGDQSHRIVYPYFAEIPTLPAEGARLGLWVMHQAIPEYRDDELRILDVLRGASFATGDVPFKGDEHQAFLRNYKAVVDEWNKLKGE